MKLPGRENLTAVCVGTITDDIRIHDIPKLKVRNREIELGFCESISLCNELVIQDSDPTRLKNVKIVVFVEIEHGGGLLFTIKSLQG